MTAEVALTARALNRATLARQLLLERADVSVEEAVRRIVAVQAQEPASPYLALWNRISGFDAADLDAAFADRAVVKASLLRITLHAVHPDDYPAFHAAMTPSLRASRLHDRRYTETGLTTEDADAALPHLSAVLVEPRTGPEVERALQERLGVTESRLWWALRTFAPLHHAPTGPPWSFRGTNAYLDASTGEPPPTRAEAVCRLVVRYLEGFGPASPQDIAQFTILRMPVVRAALEVLGDDLEMVDGPDGNVLFDVAGAPSPIEDVAAPPRFLPMWDSILLAYADRSRIIPPAYRAEVIRRNGDVLPTVLVDGTVAGVWRPSDGGIEVTSFLRVDDDTWDRLEDEASGLLSLLADRDPGVYGRYARWWDALPGEQVRVVGA